MLRPDVEDSAIQVQTLALDADIIILDAVPSSDSLTKDPGIYEAIR